MVVDEQQNFTGPSFLRRQESSDCMVRRVLDSRLREFDNVLGMGLVNQPRVKIRHSNISNRMNKSMDKRDTSNDIATLNCGAFELPLSSHMSEESQQILNQQAADQKTAQDKAAQEKNADKDLSLPATPTQEQQREAFYKTDAYQRLRTRYPVEIKLETLGGVDVEVITPAAGVSDENKDRVIINFHGGSFQSGSRISSHQESIPIAALGRIKVVSVDYRMYPEHTYPAAS